MPERAVGWSVLLHMLLLVLLFPLLLVLLGFFSATECRVLRGIVSRAPADRATVRP